MKDEAGNTRPFRFEFSAAPGDLTPYLNSFYFFESHESVLEDVLPAYSGQLILPLEGRYALLHEDGTQTSSSEPVLLAPLLKAHAFRVEGPARAFGVSFNFRGWAAVTGLDVAAHNNCALPPESGFGAPAAARLQALVDAVRGGHRAREDLPEAVSGILRPCVRDLPARQRGVIDGTLDWLSASLRPELEDLYAAAPYSPRQVQRLVKQFFGVSPVHLARRYRAVRAATLLSLPNLTPELEAEISAAFYDQPHMIKEIRHFTGRTPNRLIKKDETVVADTLDPQGYGAVSPFGSGEEEQLRRARGR